MAKKSKKSKSKKSKKSEKAVVDSYDVELPGDAELEIDTIYSFEQHSDKSATVVQFVKWNGGTPTYEKRTLYRKQSQIDEAGGDPDECAWRVGKCKGFYEKDLACILKAKGG